MEDEPLELFGLDLDTINSMPVFEQIQQIDQSTRNIDTNTKAILQELQKDAPLSPANTELEKQLLEVIEKGLPVEKTDEPLETDPADSTEELLLDEEIPVVEEILDDEEILVEEETPVEKTTDYLQLIYEEMQTQNLNTVALTESLEDIKVQNEISNNADHIISTYGLIIIPALLIIYALNRLIKPFTSY